MERVWEGGKGATMRCEMTAPIIEQKPAQPRPQRVGERPPVTLPDFRNLGVMLRILVLANAMGLAATLVKAPTPQSLFPIGLETAALLEPLLLLQILLLIALGPALRKLPYLWGCIAVLSSTVVVIVVAQQMDQRLLHLGTIPLWRALLLGLTVTGTALLYFHYRTRALNPALIAARLQALQSRIQPHFLFNTINAVLSLIRSDPKRAETALEDLADLFRSLMADNRKLIPLAEEVALCKQYLNLEVLRLGERLQIRWHVDKMPTDALVPPLILQPLIENAVYHGVQASNEPGEVAINIFVRRGVLHAILTNPFHAHGNTHTGNRMAIDNIRERLALHFDAEAGLAAKAMRNTYQVHIHLPYRKLRRRTQDRHEPSAIATRSAG
jgi:two-component system sensor histidine kinase AlgZ